MNIILLRHGESVDDILDCYGGAANYPLSENGINTAKEVAKELQNTKVDKIYSSPFERAMQTAQVINEKKQCGIVVAKGMYERNSYGVLSGCNKEECKSIYGYLLKDLRGKPGDYYSNELVMGAEPIPEFNQRIKDALYDVIQDADGAGYSDIAIVTHGNVTRSIYKNVLGVSGKVDLDLLAKTFITYENGRFNLVRNEGITIKGNEA